MATSKSYLQYVLDGYAGLSGVSWRSMMGEYILYYHGRIFAYLCDDRFLVKKTEAALRLLPTAEQALPYPGAKPMLLCEDTDDRELLQRLPVEMFDELPPPKKR